MSPVFPRHSAVCPTTVPPPTPKPLLHRVRSIASSFNFQCRFVSLISSDSCLYILPRLTVISILPFHLKFSNHFTRQFLSKMWPIQLDFLFLLYMVLNSYIWARLLSRYSDWLRAGWSGIESPWGRDVPPVHTGPGAHPAYCKMGTRSLPGVSAVGSCYKHFPPRLFKDQT